MKAIAFAALALTVAGCATQEPIRPVVEGQRIICTEAPPISPITAKPVRPVVIEDRDGDFWWGLSSDDYEEMNHMLRDIVTVLQQKEAVVQYYIKCIGEHNDNLDKNSSGPDR